MDEKKAGTIYVDVEARIKKLSFWNAIKLRIAGGEAANKLLEFFANVPEDKG